jgi:hypothetical protein
MHAEVACLDDMAGRGLRWARSSWMDLAWVVFVGVNLVAMRLVPEWQTVPFLAIWVSLTVIYGFRLWRLQPAILTLAAVTLATGGSSEFKCCRTSRRRTTWPRSRWSRLCSW